MNIQLLDQLYSLYKFQILPVSNKKIRVYSYINKYFSNADIILFDEVPEKELSQIIKNTEDLGFSVKLRDYKTIQDAEDSLFDGFFDIERSNLLLKKSYNDYVKKIEEKILFGPYEFIKTEYFDIENSVTRRDDIVNTILNNLNTKGPVLILLEAAAGFGKTSTSYEVIKHFSNNNSSNKIPLFAELSRNRQASIFKYVLYDEINARFTGLSLELVIKHIIDGRIPVIIDGFDELLKPKSLDRTEDKFEDAEPMLETIKEMLKGEAKIVLTTRRTAIFSDDEFFSWLDENAPGFTFYRYSISEPTISDWIPVSREKMLQKAGLNLKSISNPVLLAYLRSLDDEQFETSLGNIDQIIEDYIVRLMNRENERQDLNMTIDEQKRVLKSISSHLTNFDITSENKEILEKKILESDQKLLFEVLERFSPDRRPSIDQFVNKLIIHAFLDRKGETGHQVGFVNDFMLGSFIGINLLDEGVNWIGTERFIDFILTAYIPRSYTTKLKIYDILNNSLLNYVDIQKQVFVDNYLFGNINRDLNGQYFSDIEFRDSFNNDKVITDCMFSKCDFYDIDLNLEYQNLTNVYFINCNFYNCTLDKESIRGKNIIFNSCQFSPENDIVYFQNGEVEDTIEENSIDVYQKKVLENFWQSGKDRFIPFKRPGTLRLGIPPDEIPLIDEAIDQLIKLGYIIKRKGHHTLQLNLKYIKEIKKILGR